MKTWKCLVLLPLTISVSTAFNLSPLPNLILHKPSQSSNLLKTKSSYFGYTLNLRPGGILISAPRANSTLLSQQNLLEPGVIYKCSVDKDFCYSYNFDTKGNELVGDDEYSYQSTNKTEQWLGSAMSGGSKDSDVFVVCASRLRAIIPNDSALHGICYWVNGTESEQPQDVKIIKPLRASGGQVSTEVPSSSPSIEEQTVKPVQHFLQQYAQMGLDVNIAPNFKEILMGIPGYYDWAGSVIRYQSEMVRSSEGLSRRDTDSEAWAPKFASQIVQYQRNYPFKFDSYFGYSISSGYYDTSDPHKILYIATSPQADGQNGEAFIFDIVASGSIYSLDIKKTFRGSQFGEYFGYKVITEDINRDNKPDVIISAPMHSHKKHYDVGALYVFMNQGNMQFLESKIISPSKRIGRFGTAISLLGDINNDGYNDIAIGAPFEENGVVYVFLGNSEGLRENPSQVIKGDLSARNVYGKGDMFGHGISQGSDVDQNGFNDIAIGAPNSDISYLYKAYPVIEPIIRIDSLKEIQTGISDIDVRICYQMRSPSKKIQAQPLQLNMTVDPTLKRATFLENNSDSLNKIVVATTLEACENHKISVNQDIKDIFKPIEVSVSFDIVNKVPQSPRFCETCVISDPELPTKITHKVSYSTGCEGICNADLKVTAIDVPAEIIVGQSSSISLKYVVSNSGESAYMPKITFNSTTKFKKVPSNCNLNNYLMECSLGDSIPLKNNQQDEISIVLDISSIQNKSQIIVSAEVSSSGNERTPSDNIAISEITVKRESNVTATGTTMPSNLNLEKFTNIVDVKNNFEINNLGPSDIIEAKVQIQIPVAFASKQIINTNNISIDIVYNKDPVKYQVNLPTTKLEGELVKRASSVNVELNSMSYDTATIGHRLDHDSISADSELHQPNRLTKHRRRDETAAALFHTGGDYNALELSHERTGTLKNSIIAGNYPINRTVVFTCTNPSIDCLEVEFVIYSWNVNNNAPLQAIIQMSVNLNEINKILVDPFEFFIIENLVTVSAVNGGITDIINVSPNFLLNVISKFQVYTTPWWVIFLAVVGGLILLTAITFGMYKAGFFKRNKPPGMQATKTNASASLPKDEEIPLRDMNPTE